MYLQRDSSSSSSSRIYSLIVNVLMACMHDVSKIMHAGCMQTNKHIECMTGCHYYGCPVHGVGLLAGCYEVLQQAARNASLVVTFCKRQQGCFQAGQVLLECTTIAEFAP
jgi:hypothetical protein